MYLYVFVIIRLYVLYAFINDVRNEWCGIQRELKDAPV